MDHPFAPTRRRLRQRLRLVKRRRRQTLRALRGRRRTKGAERALHLFEPPLHARQPHELDARSDRGRAPAPEEKTVACRTRALSAFSPPPRRARREGAIRIDAKAKRFASKRVARATFPRTRTTRGFGGMCPSFSAIGSTPSPRALRVIKKNRRLFFFRRRVGDGAPNAPRARRASPRRARRGGSRRGVDGAPSDDSTEPRLERDRFKSRLTCARSRSASSRHARSEKPQTFETPLFRKRPRAIDGSAPNAPKAERSRHYVVWERKRVQKIVQKIDRTRRLIVNDGRTNL